MTLNKRLKPLPKIHSKLDREGEGEGFTGDWIVLSISVPACTLPRTPDGKAKGEPLLYLSQLRGASWKPSRECSLCAWTFSESTEWYLTTPENVYWLEAWLGRPLVAKSGDGGALGTAQI